MKFVPVTMSVKAAPPPTIVFGDRKLSVGFAFGVAIVNVCALEIPPPGVGVKTVTGAVPGVAMSLTEIAACS